MIKPKKYPSKIVKLNQSYPEELKGLCPLCHSIVERRYNTSEKTIYRLNGAVCVRYDLMTCTNPECKLFSVPFNPCPRFDYSQRSYGKDVLEKIGQYHVARKNSLNPKQILEILKIEYDLPISESTVARMCGDILVLTSFQIDQNTAEMIRDQEFILIALDGQEPDGDRPALWNFTDIISGRVLMTRYLNRVDYHILHEQIEDIIRLYNRPIIGFISDKQSSIRKCLEVFYPKIPHQYCTYHFSTNLWNHLEKYANNIHRKLQKTVNKLYIRTVSTDIKIFDPSIKEKVSLKTLCAPLAKEIKSTLKEKNDKFKQLKGIVGYEKLSEYWIKFTNSVELIPKKDRFAKILIKTVKKVESELNGLRIHYENAVEGLKFFHDVHKVLWHDNCGELERKNALDLNFTSIWERCQEINPSFLRNDRKSFLPTSKTPFWKFLGEWTRLWESYEPGLFNYYKFPTPIKSNVEMEQKFSTENHRFRSQSGRSHVGQMIRSRGQYVLRLQYSSEDEMDFDQIIGNSKGHLKYLRDALHENIQESCKSFRNRQIIEDVYTQLLLRMYEMNCTIMEDK
jgi:hypothetical protein